MINDKNNKPFLSVPNEIMNTKHKLHKELINFETNIELKVFIAVLATATTIFKANKKAGIQTFSTVGFLAKNSFLPGTLKLSELEKIINNMNTPFFNVLSFSNKQVEFELSDIYIKSTLKRGFSKIDLMSLKSIKDLKTTRLAILTTTCPKSPKTKTKYLNLNYLFDILEVNKNLIRTGRIREIKKSFKNLEKLGILTSWKYKYPKKKSDKVLSEHYKFHFELNEKDTSNPEEVKLEIKENSINIKEDSETLKDSIDEKFNEDFDLDELLEEHSTRNSVIGHNEYLKHT